jgi:hypothetical protein
MYNDDEEESGGYKTFVDREYEEGGLYTES